MIYHFVWFEEFLEKTFKKKNIYKAPFHEHIQDSKIYKNEAYTAKLLFHQSLCWAAYDGVVTVLLAVNNGTVTALSLSSHDAA